MARAMDLDPGDYTGTYKLIGGAPALDLANLVSYRGTARHHDWLVPAGNAHRWARAVGVKAPPDGADDELRRLRELLARIFLVVADSHTPAPDDVDRVGAMAASASARRRLDFPAGGGCARWSETELSLLDVLALDATAILTSADALSRVSACGECRWLFLDTTRNHSRRWCDPADCGNRARQRRHYHRSRASQPRS